MLVPLTYGAAYEREHSREHGERDEKLCVRGTSLDDFFLFVCFGAVPLHAHTQTAHWAILHTHTRARLTHLARSAHHLRRRWVRRGFDGRTFFGACLLRRSRSRGRGRVRVVAVFAVPGGMHSYSSKTVGVVIEQRERERNMEENPHAQPACSVTRPREPLVVVCGLAAVGCLLLLLLLLSLRMRVRMRNCVSC